MNDACNGQNLHINSLHRWFWRKDDFIVKQVGTFAVASICIASISVQSGKVGETRTGFQNRKQKKKKKTQNFQLLRKELEELEFILVKHDKHLCRPALLAGNNKDLVGVAWQSSVHSYIAFFFGFVSRCRLFLSYRSTIRQVLGCSATTVRPVYKDLG